MRIYRKPEILPGSHPIVFSKRRSVFVLGNVSLEQDYSYEGGSRLNVNRTLTWNNNREIDGQRKVVPFRGSCHINKVGTYIAKITNWLNG